MPSKRNPRKSSMQVWPRKRSARMTARIRHWPVTKDVKLLGFVGYKAGMTHIINIDNHATTPTKGEEISTPVTIIECPALRIIAIKTVKNDYGGRTTAQFKWADKLDKNIMRAMSVPKKPKTVELNADGIIEVRVLVATQPQTIGLKKTPDIVELGVGGSVNEALEYAKKILGSEIKTTDVFSDGQQVDAHAVTKGRGLQGPVKRHGVMIRSHKAEKTKRGPASLGPWSGGKMYRVAHAGQMGFQRRIDYNKWIMRVDGKPEDFNPKGGFIRYGELRASCIILKGSTAGATKRLVTLTVAQRPNTKLPKAAPEMIHISKASKQ